MWCIVILMFWRVLESLYNKHCAMTTVLILNSTVLIAHCWQGILTGQCSRFIFLLVPVPRTSTISWYTPFRLGFAPQTDIRPNKADKSSFYPHHPPPPALLQNAEFGVVLRSVLKTAVQLCKSESVPIYIFGAILHSIKQTVYGWNFSGRTEHGNYVIFFLFLATVFGNLEVWKVKKWNIFLKYISAGV